MRTSLDHRGSQILAFLPVHESVLVTCAINLHLTLADRDQLVFVRLHYVCSKLSGDIPPTVSFGSLTSNGIHILHRKISARNDFHRVENDKLAAVRGASYAGTSFNGHMDIPLVHMAISYVFQGTRVFLPQTFATIST